MIGADGVRLALLIVAPLWIDWMPDNALAVLLVTVFVTGVAERLWTVAKESAAPALLPAPPLEGAAVRPLPDHLDALRRLSLRTGFVAVPARRGGALVATLIGNLLGAGLDWFVLPPGGARLRTSPPVCSPPRISILYLPRTARHPDPPAALAAGGPAPPHDRHRARQGPYRRPPAARRRPARRSPGRSPPPSPSPCCTPRTWAAGPVTFALLSSR